MSDLLRILRHAVVGLVTGHCGLRLHLYRIYSGGRSRRKWRLHDESAEHDCLTVAVLSMRELFTFDDLVKGHKIPEEQGLVRGI